MKSSFSELSYAFALTDNLVRVLGIPLLSAPTFPSTAAEGKKGGGYDLKLSCPGAALFLQFKLSDCMTYKSAREFTSGKFRQAVGGVKKPVYRMYLHALSKSRQTSLMLKLEKRHGSVYYVAPLFHLASELSEYYFSQSVVAESRFLRPSVIRKMPDQLEHFVSFRNTGKPWRFSDEPLELEYAETKEHIVALLKDSIQRQVTAQDAISNAMDAMLEAITDDLGERQQVPRVERQELDRLRRSDMPTLATAEFVARTYFDAQLLTFGTFGDQASGS